MGNFLGIIALSSHQVYKMDLVTSKMKARVFQPPRKVNSCQIDPLTFTQLIISNFVQCALWNCYFRGKAFYEGITRGEVL